MDHLPVNPVRLNHYEIAFSACWKELMERQPREHLCSSPDDTMIDNVLGEYPEYAGDRESKVCATIITWLGTNVGRGFMDKCGFFDKRKTVTEDSVFIEWTKENRRYRAVNSGWRTLEHLLTDREKHTEVLGKITRLNVQRCSALDYEAADHLMIWLGSDEGQEFVKRVWCMANSAHIERLIEAFKEGGLEAAYEILKPYDPVKYEEDA